MRKILLWVTFGLICFQANSQECGDTENKKAKKYFEEATDLFKSKKYDDAREAVNRALKEDEEYGQALYLSGYIALKKKDDKTFDKHFSKAIELCPEADPEAYYQLGWMKFDLKDYKKADEYLSKFLSFDKINEDHGAKAEVMLAKAKLIARPVPFNPAPVKDISTSDPEYLPYISPDNELAFFTRRFELKEKSMLTPMSVEKFMIAHLKSPGVFDKGEPMPPPFNSAASNNEGGASITIDNRHLFFTVNTKGNFDICTSDFANGKWSEIRNLGPNVNDPKQWDSQPSISSDGKTLFFASARNPESGIDIYMTTKDDNGEWTKAKRLPAPINTNGNDKSPFMHSDSKTLYFSSDSLPGLGGYDIFKTTLNDDGKWSKPVNLGYPINTDADEVGFFVSTDGQTGYFASNKLSSPGGGFDIYSFMLYPEARPEKVYFQKGGFYGTENDKPVDATIEVKDAVTKKLTKIKVDSLTGEYAFVVNLKNDLIISVKKDGYAFESQYVSGKDSISPVKKKDITLQKLEVGGQYNLNDILFSSNSFELNDTIKTVLDEFADYLKINPRIRVAMQGHTDNVGNPATNMTLSENRARTVYEYLISLGIDKSRLSFKGFGETKPVASNTTDEGRAKNRRTVFVVTSK